MPALFYAPELVDLASRAAQGNSTVYPPLKVVCAWPVSGQYGPGSRVLYVLVDEFLPKTILLTQLTRPVTMSSSQPVS